MRTGKRGEFSSCERMFVCQRKMAGETFPNIRRKFMLRFGKLAPSRSAMKYMVDKLRNRFSVQDMRKGNSGRKKTVRTPEAIASVKRSLERASLRNPGEPGPSARRNPQSLDKSSYNRITREDLNLKPYKILRLHKVTEEQTMARLKMGRLLARKSLAWYENLAVSDEAWFCLSGHVFNRQNNVCYSPAGSGTPNQWRSEAAQSSLKVMVFCCLTGCGQKFGPFFLADGGRVTQHSYKELLESQLFPQMKEKLGRRRWSKLVWQQDGAGPHQANMVMDWLDGVFANRMLALKSRRGNSWAPSSPDMNPADFFLWGYLKEKVYSPPPTTIPALKRKIRDEFRKIPEQMVMTSVKSMKRRAIKLVNMEGKQFEGNKDKYLDIKQKNMYSSQTL